MYLKSLELSGFKSFSKKTVLSFSPAKKGVQSITAVVGPNGSGKSNIADAIRWVLGEQSLKMLRGKKSEDIIFGGSVSKSKMGMASVTLTIDNSDGLLPVDYEELVINRRVYRGGENEYILNGMQIRLLDLQLLLAKAQFGQGSYSVIGQGMIDRMLLQSSAERKDFFDEAFGIKEFQIKRHQAMLKLSRTKENIGQAEALLAEVFPRLKTLTRQVKKLEERQEVEKSLRDWQETYFSTVWLHNLRELGLIKKELVDIEKRYESTDDKLKTFQLELSNLAKESSRQEMYNDLQAKYQKILKEKNTLERERATLQGKMQVEYSKAGQHNVGWLDSKITKLQEDQILVANDLGNADNNLTKLNTDIADKKIQLEKLTLSRTELRARLSTLESALAQAKSEQNYFQLTGLRAVQAVLEEQQRFGGRIFGAVAQLAEVDDKYQLAMDVAAGTHLSSLVVSDDEVGKGCIRYLRENQLGVATFLPLSKIKPRYVSADIDKIKKESGVYGLATDLAKFDNRFNTIFSYVFGNTLIVKDLEIARRIGIGRVRMVTLEGDILETSGSMKGGFRKQKTMGLSFAHAKAPHQMQNQSLEQTEKIEKTKKDLDETEMLYEQMNDVVRDMATTIEIEKKKQQFVDEQKKAIDRELAALRQEKNLSTMSKSDYGVAMKDLEKDKASIETKVKDLDKDLSKAEARIDALHAEEEKKKKRIFVLQDEMQEEQGLLNSITAEKNERAVAIAKLETKQEDLSAEVYQELHCSIESIIKREAGIVEMSELQGLQAKIQKLKYKLTLIGGIDEDVVEEHKEVSERHSGLTTQLDDLGRALLNLEKLVVDLDEIMKIRRSKGFKEIQKEFKRYFSLLFDGGKSDLVEVYDFETPNSEEEEMEKLRNEEIKGMEDKKFSKKKILSGIEVIACPPGKKINNITALSGGERTLTSIALICAILNSNPPPFVVLDEVEAALDEANTLRFTKILKELARKSQFVLITHNRATMHACDVLYGVTMGNDGISHLLSVKLGQVATTIKA